MSADSLPILANLFMGGASALSGKAASNALKVQAHASREQAAADEASKRRENAALRGEQAAALAENGLSGTGSSALKANQDAALAELDALNIRYAGKLRRADLLSEAKSARTSGYTLAGTQLLQGVGENYLRGRRVPQGT